MKKKTKHQKFKAKAKKASSIVARQNLQNIVNLSTQINAQLNAVFDVFGLNSPEYMESLLRVSQSTLDPLTIHGTRKSPVNLNIQKLSIVNDKKQTLKELKELNQTITNMGTIADMLKTYGVTENQLMSSEVRKNVKNLATYHSAIKGLSVDYYAEIDEIDFIADENLSTEEMRLYLKAQFAKTRGTHGAETKAIADEAIEKVQQAMRDNGRQIIEEMNNSGYGSGTTLGGMLKL